MYLIYLKDLSIKKMTYIGLEKGENHGLLDHEII
jgi:hypothetical protein